MSKCKKKEKNLYDKEDVDTAIAVAYHDGYRAGFYAGEDKSGDEEATKRKIYKELI